MPNLNDIIREFQETDDDFRLDLLLDYAEKLPMLPTEIQNRIRQEQQRVPECQTPVYLEVTAKDHVLKIQADVPPESPTVRGVISILLNALDGRPIQEIEEIPTDLLNRLGLQNKIGSVRLLGINAILTRLRRMIKQVICTEQL